MPTQFSHQCVRVLAPRLRRNPIHCPAERPEPGNTQGPCSSIAKSIRSPAAQDVPGLPWDRHLAFARDRRAVTAPDLRRTCHRASPKVRICSPTFKASERAFRPQALRGQPHRVSSAHHDDGFTREFEAAGVLTGRSAPRSAVAERGTAGAGRFSARTAHREHAERVAWQPALRRPVREGAALQPRIHERRTRVRRGPSYREVAGISVGYALMRRSPACTCPTPRYAAHGR
jgi:hypothetical protein